MAGMENRRVTIIAEVGLMHDGKLENALRLVDAVAGMGADAIKFQTHLADAETLMDAPSPSYFSSESRYDYFTRTAFDGSQWKKIRKRCEKAGVGFMSSAFSVEAVDLLERVGIEGYKVPSGEVTNIPYLERIAATGKPVLLSSGMSNWKELDRAVAVFKKKKNKLTVLQCTSQYPCPNEKVGLNVLVQMKTRYKTPVGLSDHTLTAAASLAAVALGATVIEKHVVLSRNLYGSDAKHSMEPPEFTDMVKGIRSVEAMVTHPVDKNDLSSFRDMKKIFEKSVASLTAIQAGSVIKADQVGCRKPGGGLAPERLKDVIGRRAARAIPAGRVLIESDIVWRKK